METSDSSEEENEASDSDEDLDNDSDQENHLSDDEDYKMSGSEDENNEDEEDDDEEDVDDDDDEGEEEEEDESSADETVGNAAWADSIAKVLNSKVPKNQKSIVLSKAKKISDVAKKENESKNYGFQIDGEEIKKEDDTKPDETELNTEVIKLKLLERRKIRDHLYSLRVKPSINDRERDKTFKRIATRGVVQLFNAVRTQQKDISKKLDEAGPLDHRRDRALNSLNKRAFLDVLMGGSRAKSELIDNPVKKEEKFKEEDDDDYDDDDDDDMEYDNVGTDKEIKKTWSILKDDFMKSSKLKNWDKEDEDEPRGEVEMDSDSD